MDDCVLFCAISNGLSLWIGSGKSDDDSKVSPEKKGAFECMHIYEHPLFLLEKCLLSCHMFYIVELSIHQCSHSMRFLQIRESKKLKFVGFEMKNQFSVKLWIMAKQFIRLFQNASNSKPLCRYVNPSFSIILLQLNPIPNGSSPFFFASTIFHSQTLKMCGDHLVLTLLLEALDWQGCSIL